MKKHLVVLSGAGISAESGIPTFRASDGLWENHRIEEVATPEGFQRNPALVLQFYNERRTKAANVSPNLGHLILAELEQDFKVTVITQNVDNLHERAGSTHVIHLHGELAKARSSRNPNEIIEIGSKEIKLGDKAPDGSQLRPHIVWFGEAVPMIELAAEIVASADILVVVGTSLQVYPAAGLVQCAGIDVPIYVIDPKRPEISNSKNMTFIEEVGSVGLRKLQDVLI
ncbi:MAG: NAD-dependent deacylase [Bacteroidota bacterium]